MRAWANKSKPPDPPDHILGIDPEVLGFWEAREPGKLLAITGQKTLASISYFCFQTVFISSMVHFEGHR